MFLHVESKPLTGIEEQLQQKETYKELDEESSTASESQNYASNMDSSTAGAVKAPCAFKLQPKTDTHKLNAQLAAPYPLCQGQLVYQPCDLKDTQWRWRDGVHYRHEGWHKHEKPCKIHLTYQRNQQFEATMKAHPLAGPLELLVGVHGLEGPSKLVSDISPIFLNKNRIGQRRCGIIKAARGDGTFLDTVKRLQEFVEKNQDRVVHHSLIPLVICIQTPWMWKVLGRSLTEEDPVNGLVSDAAHGPWVVEDLKSPPDVNLGILCRYPQLDTCLDFVLGWCICTAFSRALLSTIQVH
ncbi:hypothetical protein NP233_g2918 [Leucocoprinus birnbaumii]|uniref:Uncharacterized protein n=1 Tax=Leucocoprinus birnbaumii TaxID=56174 RepID=A0AAD5YT96_9AGAR|nr:hypothetical protein NP233_g2918 [Leucocoprinus birnbaumii]